MSSGGIDICPAKLLQGHIIAGLAQVGTTLIPQHYRCSEWWLQNEEVNSFVASLLQCSRKLF